MDLSLSGKYGDLHMLFHFLCWDLIPNENYGNVSSWCPLGRRRKGKEGGRDIVGGWGMICAVREKKGLKKC